MVAGNMMTIRHEASILSYGDVVRIASHIRRCSESPATVIVDLRNTSKTSTAALAKLILVRRILRKSGRDLCISGLAGKPGAMYRIYRLAELLPHICERRGNGHL
jgi:ABC-type transporter Mla MlaB component